MTRAEYDAALAEMRKRLGSGYAIVPLYPDQTMIAAACDQFDTQHGVQSYTDVFSVMVQSYVTRKERSNNS